jgi:hypothetical protein
VSNVGTLAELCRAAPAGGLLKLDLQQRTLPCGEPTERCAPGADAMGLVFDQALPAKDRPLAWSWVPAPVAVPQWRVQCSALELRGGTLALPAGSQLVLPQQRCTLTGISMHGEPLLHMSLLCTPLPECHLVR